MLIAEIMWPPWYSKGALLSTINSFSFSDPVFFINSESSVALINLNAISFFGISSSSMHPIFGLGDWFFMVQKKWPLVFLKSFCGFSLKNVFNVSSPYYSHIFLLIGLCFIILHQKNWDLVQNWILFEPWFFGFFLVFATEKLNSTLYTTLNSLSIYHKIRQNDFLVQNGFFWCKN